jgi:hypothetical protein
MLPRGEADRCNDEGMDMRLIGVAAVGAMLLVSAAAKADLLVTISKSQQRMSVAVDGAELYRWPVSTGRRGFATPSGNFHPVRLERHWYSRQYDMTPMPWSMFFFRGYAVHGTMEARNLGHAASHGCVRLRPDHAATLFSLMRKQNLAATKIVVIDRPLPPVPGATPMADADAVRPVAVSAVPAAKSAADDNVAAETSRAAAPSPAISGAEVKAVAQVRASEPRHHVVAARGDEAAVLRRREAWLRGLAHKYGFREW